MAARMILKRIAMLVPLLFLVSVMIFSVTYLIPGDPASVLAGEFASTEDIARVRAELHLDRPFLQQYVSWIGGVVHGDLGRSLQQNVSVGSIIKNRAPATLSLGFFALTVAIVLGVGLGMLAGTKMRSPRDRLSIVIASIGVALPNFWLGLLFVTLFAVKLGWFPATGFVAFTSSPLQWLHYLVLPGFTLGIAGAAEIARQTRASMGHTLENDYIRTARMKGLPRRKVVGKHALKNAAGPVVTTIGLQATVLLGGTVIVERVFGINGLGSAALDAVSARDMPVVQGIALLTTVISVVVNLIVDLTYGYLNPKVRIS